MLSVPFVRSLRVLAGLVLLAATSAQGQSATLSDRGKDFWVGFMLNSSGGQELRLKIASLGGTTGTVTMPLTGWSMPFTVSANSVATVVVPNTAENTGSEVIRNLGIHITTLDSVTVTAMNYQNQTTDAAQILPLPSLGTSYRTDAYIGLPGWGDIFRSEMLIVATADGTEVNVIPSVPTVGGHPAGVPFTVLLNAGQTYQIQAASASQDLTGTRVVGTAQSGPCRPFAVFGGSSCAQIPIGCMACDHVYEQMTPVNTWGTAFHTVPLDGPPVYAWRVMADQNGTMVSVNGGAPFLLNAGQTHEETGVTQAVCITADKPVSVMEMMEGMNCSGVGDPATVLLAPDDRLSRKAMFETLHSSFPIIHHLSVVTPTAAIGQMVLDGVAMNASLFQPYTSCPGFSYAKLPLAPGTHKLSSHAGFLAYTYGTAQGEGYMCGVAGVSIPAPPTDTLICSSGPLTLTPPVTLVNAVWTAASAPSTILSTSSSYTFTPDHNDIYRVDGELPVSGCPKHYEFQVGLPVEPHLLLNVNGSSTATVCQYAPAQLGSGAGLDPAWFDLHWSPAAQVSDPASPNPIAYPTATTWFKLSVTSPIGCGSAVDSVLVTVTPNNVYAVHASTTDDAICAGNSTTLQAQAERVFRSDAFDPGLASWWAQVQGGVPAATCGSVSGNALYFNGAGTRSATTTPMDLSMGGRVHFALKIAAGAAPCDDAEPGEDVRLEYSLNGSSWVPLNTFNEAMYPAFTVVHVTIPALGPTGTNAQLRWRQLANSGAGQDNWCLDNVLIARYDNTGLGMAWTPAATVGTPASANTAATPAADQWYRITTTTPGGCSYIDSTLITVAPAFSIVPINDTTRCGIPGTQLQAAVTSGTGILWSWAPNDGSLNNTTIAAPVATPATTTTYTVTATNAIGCMDTEDVSVRVSRLTGLTVSANDLTLCQGEQAQLNAAITATGPNTVSWSPAAGLNNPASPTPIATPTAATNYVCTVTDSGSGCFLTGNVALNVNTAYAAHASNDTTICTALGLQLHVQHNVPAPYQIAWTPAADLNAANIADPSILVDASATYRVRITDANGCSVQDSVVVTVAFDNLITPVDVSTCDGQGLVLDAGFPGSTYDWSTNEHTQTITVTEPGSYTATMTDIQQCQAIMTFIVAFDPLPTIDLGPDLALCGVNAYVLDANNPGNDVHWNTGPHAQQLTVTSSGTYSAVVTTPQGCQSSDAVHITLDPLPLNTLQNVTACESTPPVLNAGNPGSIYDWSTHETTQSIVPAASGAYSVTVTTAAHCSATFSTQVTLMPAIHVDLGPDTTLCTGQPLVLDAGNPGNAFDWNTSAHTQTIPVGSSGTYSVQVTNGYCTGADAVQVTFDPLPTDVLNDVTSCIDQPVMLDAGNTGSSFHWSNDSTTAGIEVTTGGLYTVTITNAHDCSATYDALVTFVDYPVVELGPDTSLCDGEILVLDAGNPGAIYAWSNGPATRTIDVTEAGTYTVSVDNGYCVSTDTRLVHFDPVPGHLDDHQLHTCFDERPTLALDAGNPGCLYLWSTGEHTQAIEVGTYGTYTVRITNGFDCSTVDSITVNEFCPPSLFIPNTFTPNGDGLNDVWTPVGRNLAQFELFVFDRWGGIAFHSTDPAKGWDGTIDGKPAPNDTYAWRMIYRFVEKSDGGLGFEHKELGHVQIMR